MDYLNKDVSRFIKFGIVGVINTLINWIIFAILNFIGVYYIISNIIAYSIATLNSYLWNSKWVFKYNGKDIKETTIKFISLNLIGLLLNTGVLYYLVDVLGLKKIISLIIATAIITIINYVVNKIWIFKKR